MNIDLKKLERNLWRAEPEKTLPDDKVNPYLLNVLLRRLQAGEDVTYGEVDFSQFAADDLRVLADYINRQNGMSARLSRLVDNMDRAEPFCCTARAFC